MTDTTPKINAATGSGTGIDQELARKLFDKGPGTVIVAVVEMRVVKKHGPHLDDTTSVDLNIIGLQPVYDDPETEDHLRNIKRRLWHERKVATDGETLPGVDGQAGEEPSVADLVTAGAKYEPHDFIQAPGEPEDQVCDRCGKPKFAKLHNADDPEPAASDEEPEPAPADAEGDATGGE